MLALSLVIAGFIFFALAYSSIVSWIENEKRAAGRMIWLALILPLPFLIPFFDIQYNELIAIILVSCSLGGLLLFLLPIGRNPKKYTFPNPAVRIDERDTMFSRRELKKGTEQFAEYYQRNPDKEAIDNTWRGFAGLLSKGSTLFNEFHFAAADASFDTIDALKHEVDGPVNMNQTKIQAQAITKFIKGWVKKLGALDTGITELHDYHIYSVGGRAERYGKRYTKNHSFAIAFTVEMSKEMVDGAPSASIVMESGQQYLESGKVAIQLARFIRKLGYEARAHVDGNYEVICPLVARDAGLGEIGRMGLLMTPRLGPRVRIAVVTTNLPLLTDKALKNRSMIDFCTICKKCADACPSKAISFSNQESIDGIKRWQINQEACFGLWCQMGTDCGRCMSVCPYSHPDNLMHNIIRAGIRNSILFRKAALFLDDFFYGRNPASKEPTGWMNPEVEK